MRLLRRKNIDGKLSYLGYEAISFDDVCVHSPPIDDDPVRDKWDPEQEETGDKPFNPMQAKR